MPDPIEVPLPAIPAAARCRRPVIEPNGKEYLVTMNGAVFVALSRAQAEAIASRMSGRSRGVAMFGSDEDRRVTSEEAR